MRWPVCSSLDTTSPPRRLRSSTSESPVAFSVELTSSMRLAIDSVEVIAGLDHELGELLRAAGHHVENGGGLLREAVGHAVEPHRHHVLQVGGDLGELVADMVGLEIQRRRQPVGGRADRLGGSGRSGFQAVEQFAAAFAECSIMLSPAWPSAQRDVLALFGKRMGDAARGVVDLIGHQLADRGNVLAEIEMHASDGVADLLGLADQRVALAGEILQQAADADFVVVIGVLERGHLVGHQRLELGGARQCAFHAVAHRGDFAADRLADGDDRFPRHRLRLGEPHGDFRHGLRDQPQFLRAPRHMGEHVEEDDRREENQRQHDEHRRGHAARPERRLQLRQVEPGEAEAADHPDRGEDAGEDVGGVAGRRCSARRIWPIDSRSSLAGRRSEA